MCVSNVCLSLDNNNNNKCFPLDRGGRPNLSSYMSLLVVILEATVIREIGEVMKRFVVRFACLEKPDSNTGNQNRLQVHVSRPLRSWQGRHWVVDCKVDYWKRGMQIFMQH